METNNNPTIQEGWTLRDEFANSAMSNLLPENATGCFGGYPIGINDINQIAETAYLIADAMLKQRKNGK